MTEGAGERRANGGSGPVLALSGGVGGAKLAVGLARVLEPDELTIVCNTADDFEHLGLHVSPDLDSVMYALSGRSDSVRGWGRADEGWRFMESLGELGGETWFRLGDRDLATHVLRSQGLCSGLSLTEITARLFRALEILHTVSPMSDDPVRTVVDTADGEIAFQHYFVKQQCRPTVRGFRFEGIEQARASSALLEPLRDPGTRAIVICPSNPFVSIDPILHLPGVEAALRSVSAPRLAVSPIVGGQAIKGPAAKMMTELAMPATALEIGRYYAARGLIDILLIDEVDADWAPAIRDLGLEVVVAPSVMTTLEDRVALAAVCLKAAARR